MTSVGIGVQNSRTRSAPGPAAARSSKVDETMSSILGRSSRARLVVNDPVSSRRSRVCSGPS